jgi:outer membrane protein, protease secretion system
MAKGPGALKWWFACGLAVAGQLVCAEGLQDAYEAARGHDPKFRAALREFEGSQEARIQGRAGLLPDIFLSGSVARNELDRTIGRTTENLDYRSDSKTLQLRQPLLNFDATARYRQGEAQSLYGEAVFASRKRELILRMLESYSNVLLSQEQVALAEAQAATFSAQVQASERLLALGEGTKTEVFEARSGYEVALAQIVEARNSLDNVTTELAAIIGPRLKPVPRRLAKELPLVALEPGTLAEWEAIATERSSDIELRRQALDVARQEVARTEAGHLPRIDLVASVNRSDSETINTINQQNAQRSVGLQFSLPLFSGGRVSSQVRQALAAQGRAEAELDDATQTVLGDVRKQFNAVRSGALRVRALEKALETTQLQVEATKKSVEGGVRVALDVLNAEQQRYLVARDLAQARFLYLLSWLRLRSAAGLLDAPDLANVESHFMASGQATQIFTAQ